MAIEKSDIEEFAKRNSVNEGFANQVLKMSEKHLGDGFVGEYYFDLANDFLDYFNAGLMAEKMREGLEPDKLLKVDKYEIQTIEDDLGQESYRITDNKTNSRVATCYLLENANKVVDALNKHG